MANSGIFGGIDTLVWGKKAKKVYGTKPLVPELPTLEEAQGQAIGGNIKSLAEAQQLAGSVNAFNQAELDKILEMAVPGARASAGDALSAMLRGEIPQGTLTGLRRTAAERGLAAGTMGGGFQLGRELGSQLGMSLQLIQQGLSSTEQWLQATSAPRFDVTSMFITPQQKYADAGNQFNQGFTAAKIAAAPDPVARGEFDTTMALIGMVLSAYGGGGGYQGTYNQAQNYGQSGGQIGPAQAPNSFYIGGGNYGMGKQSGGSWFMGARPGSG